MELILGIKTISGVAVGPLLTLAKFLLLVHLAVQSFSFIEDLHQFLVYLVRIQLLQDVLLVLKLVLWLFLLLQSLLLLDSCVSILGLFGSLVLGHFFEVLTMALSSLVVIVVLDLEADGLLLLFGVHS